MANSTNNVQLTKSGKKAMRADSIQGFLMILLPLIGFLILQVYPIIWTFRWAFYNYNGIPSYTTFAGVDNFIKMFTTDLTYWKTWVQTLTFGVLKIPFEIPLAMIIALLLSRKGGKLTGFFRSAYYLPNVISVVVVGLLITNIFTYSGLINTWLLKLGIIKENIDWFTTKGKALTMLVSGAVWNTFGINVMYFLAALCNVPEDLYESATLDGASKWTQFWKITVPMISPVLSTILLLSVIGTLGVNEYIIVVTNGAPSGTTQTVMSYLTTKFVPGFSSETTPPLGYGCAMSLVTTVCFGLTSIGYNKINKKINSIF